MEPNRTLSSFGHMSPTHVPGLHLLQTEAQAPWAPGRTVGPQTGARPPLQLQFQISLNEEHVFLSVAQGAGQPIVLGERSHHYCLVTLARRRLADAQRGVEHSGQGWIAIEQLSKMLGMEPGHLNVQIFRARQQIRRALPPEVELGDVVERRRGEIRFSALHFRIVRGSTLEGEFAPAVSTGSYG